MGEVWIFSETRLNGAKRGMAPSPAALARNILFSEAGTQEQYNKNYYGFESELVILKSINLTSAFQLKLQEFSRNFPGSSLKENYRIPGFFQDFSLGVL